MLVGISAAYVAALLVSSLWRRLRRVLSSPSFVEVQRRTIRRVMNSAVLNHFLSVDDNLLRTDIDRYNEQQASAVELTIGTGIAVNKLLLLWAHQLNRYRRRHAPALIFTSLSYIWIFLAALLGLTLLNIALLKLDPSQFQFEAPRPAIAVLAYTLSTFALGSAGGIDPVGQLAYGLQVVGGLTGLLVLATLFINLVITYVRERDDMATDELVAELREEAHRLDERFRRDYEVGIDEAYARLQRLGAAMASMLAYLVRAIPADPGDRPRPGPE